MEMNTKNLLVSFVMALVLVTTVSAAELTTDYTIEIDGVNVVSDVPAVIAGEKVVVEIEFTSLVCDNDVTIEVELEGDKVDSKVVSRSFDVENGTRYIKKVSLEVPYELKDDLSDELFLHIEIDGNDHKTEIEDIELRVQRPSYNADVKSFSVPQSVSAGETFPVDVVLKNTGYNDLDDLYVTAIIPALGVEKTLYFGDLVSLKCGEECDEVCYEDDECDCDCDEEDQETVSGRIYLTVPYDAKPGVYAVELAVENEDATISEVMQIVIGNAFPSNVIVSSNSQSATVGAEAEYSLLLVNPTNTLKVYRIVTESSGDVSASVREAVVAVPAGSSKTVAITASAVSEGQYTFDVNVFSGESLVEKVTLTLDAKGGSQVTNPIVVLTIVLAIVFLVLLVVLIVLITKKPEKSEEFGESYY